MSSSNTFSDSSQDGQHNRAHYTYKSERSSSLTFQEEQRNYENSSPPSTRRESYEAKASPVYESGKPTKCPPRRNKSASPGRKESVNLRSNMQSQGSVRSSIQSREDISQEQGSNQESNEQENCSNECWPTYDIIKLVLLFLATFILMWFMLRVYATINNEAVIISPLLRQPGSGRNRKNAPLKQKGPPRFSQVPTREKQNAKRGSTQSGKSSSAKGKRNEEMIPAHRMLFDEESARELHNDFCSKKKKHEKTCK